MNFPSSSFLRLMRHAALTLSVVLALLACSFSEEYEEPSQDNDVHVAFVLTVDHTSTRSDMGWDHYDPTDEGTDKECAIRPDDIHIKICDAEGRVIGNVEDIHMERMTQDQYSLTGAWMSPGNLLKDAKKVMILANCGSAAASNEIADITYSADRTDGFIPMWGVRSFTSLTKGESNDLGDIHLLRAMAKVSLKLRSDMESRGYSVGKLTLNHRNTLGYCLPLTYQSVDKTTDIRFEGSLHELTSPATDGGLDFTSTGYAYLPERSNTRDGVTPSTITLQLFRNGTLDDTYTLPFCVYDAEGAPTDRLRDIQRNTLYLFEVYKADNQLKISLHVRRWYVRDHDDVIM